MSSSDARRLHFVGIGGSGMSALAQYEAMRGAIVSGSDRDFDRGERAAIREALERLGVTIVPQDGSGVSGAGRVVASTAIESAIPDLVAARAEGVPVVHRSELLAEHVHASRTVAVAGSSGKSTVVAMLFEILAAAGLDPSTITGGNVRALTRRGYLGNAWFGGELLIVEADESDGSLERYSPELGVVLNVHRDHEEIDVLADMFLRFAVRAVRTVLGDDPALRAGFAEAAAVFGAGDAAGWRASVVQSGADGVAFDVVPPAGDVLHVRVPFPGAHTVANALAAITASYMLGVDGATAAAALAGFAGVGRRFESIGCAGGVEVVDDFAHNPKKIEASLQAARERTGGRVLAVFQPHGFGPTRFLWDELIETFGRSLRRTDLLWLLPIYDAGGTARRDIDSPGLAGAIGSRSAATVAAVEREALAGRVADRAVAGDLVLVMGARDPSLTALCRSLVEHLGRRPA